MNDSPTTPENKAVERVACVACGNIFTEDAGDWDSRSECSRGHLVHDVCFNQQQCPACDYL